jgi:hypothetical protein
MPPAGSQQQILRTIDFWQLSVTGCWAAGPGTQLLDFLAHHPYFDSPGRRRWWGEKRSIGSSSSTSNGADERRGSRS